MAITGATGEAALREQLAKALDWGEAHTDFAKTISGIPPELRGVVPPGLPHSAWQLLEHLRIALHDILDFTVNPDYEEMKWPDDYWPSPAPPTPTAWDESVAAYGRDIATLRALVLDAKTDLLARIPHGTGQTYLREVLLVIDHAGYHLGQLILVRRLLGNWT